MDLSILTKLKNTPEMVADQHDGSYELMRSIIKSYQNVGESLLDFHDLNAIYLMSVGTFRHGIPAKKKVIEKSHLSADSKIALKELLDNILNKAIRGSYNNEESNKAGGFGMFGSGFFSFQGKTDNQSVRGFIKMCIDISNMNDDEEMYKRASEVINKNFKGMRAASASTVLHCIKPYSFPVLNSKIANQDIFAALGIKLNKPNDIDTYIDNCREIKLFRDKNLPFRNYRILDLAANELDGSDPISQIIKRYKAEFTNWDTEERYKWEAIKCFQDNWKIDAVNFSDMLDRALAKSYNLLTSYNLYARLMIVFFAQKDPEKVRKMFTDLYNEDDDLVNRIKAFFTSADELLEMYKDPQNPKMKQHYQRHNIISIYLFFRYPEKYYIYKYQKYKDFASRIGWETTIKQNEAENVAGYIEMCDAVLAKVLSDTELQKMSEARLDQKCYADPQFHMLTDDIVYFGSKIGEEPNGGVPTMAEYSKNMILYGPPGTGKTYQSVIYAVAIIDDKPLTEIINMDFTEVMKRFNELKEARFIEFTTFHQSYGYEEFIEGIKPVLYNEQEESEAKSISYEIVDGIFKAFCMRAQAPIIKKTNVFGFSESPTVWKVSLWGTGNNPIRQDCMEKGYIRIGWDEYGPQITDETIFNRGGKNVLNAFINRMQIGDIVLSCFSERTIDAIGVVTGDYEWHADLNDYRRIRKVNWLVKGMNYDIYEMNNNTVMTLSTVYRLSVSVADVINILNQNSSVNILQSESFGKYVFIIDEINRGNISKIFGELITLIEPTKRLGKLEAMRSILPYSKKAFGVPDNVYIIGTMNTADRSIALIDTALRRRFDFIENQPDLAVLTGINIGGLSIADMLNKINRRIEVLVDREHTIGHSYFLCLKDDPSLSKLAHVFAQNIIPLLQEYFYEDYEKIRLVLGDSHKEKYLQFIQKKEEDTESIFGAADFDFDEIAAYEINQAAFANIEAYKNI